MGDLEHDFHYQIGDLVQFKHNHLNVIRVLTGIIVERSLRMTRDDMYKIKVENPNRSFWQCRTKLELLSSVVKPDPK